MSTQKDSTIVTIVISGERHKEAADALVIQFADGGMDEDIEQRLEMQDYSVEDTDFDTDTRELFVKLAE